MNNAQVIAPWRGTEWEPFLEEADRVLESIAPGYTLSQVKTKFGECRFYASAPDGATAEVSRAVQMIARYTERACNQATKRKEEEQS